MDKVLTGASGTALTKACWRTIALLASVAPGWALAQGALPPAAGPAAQSPELMAPPYRNPGYRNPDRRSGIPDTSPVTQDLRDSSSRPTLPAASDLLDPRDTLPVPDSARDAPPQAPQPPEPPGIVPVTPPGLPTAGR